MMNTPTSPQLDAEIFSRLFSETYHQFDLREGTAINSAGVRVIYLSSDIVRGIYEALHYEAGDAWKLILENSGYLWGKHMFESLIKEIQAVSQKNLESLPASDYLHVLETYFSMHGWGKAKIHLQDAPFGIIRVRMTHSLFADALNNVDDRVDAMIAGMLRGFFEKVSGGQSLGCVETACVRRNAAPYCEFLISGMDRISKLRHLIDDEVSPEKILEQLRIL